MKYFFAGLLVILLSATVSAGVFKHLDRDYIYKVKFDTVCIDGYKFVHMKAISLVQFYVTIDGVAVPSSC